MRDYQQLAAFLQDLPQDPQARIFYDIADALVWSDEVPPLDFPGREAFSAVALRAVWRYRTTLILGQPDEKFRCAWEEAMKCFARWPGFEPKRREASLTATFIVMQETAMNQWEADLEESVHAALDSVR